MYKVASLNAVIKELKDVQGTEVTVFGQPQTVPTTEEDDLYLDTVDVLESLTDYEASDLIEEIEEDFDGDLYDWIEAQENAGIMKEEGDGDNTYNWNANVSHHINFSKYNHEDGTFVVVIRAHLYGDVRGNYTDSTVLKFDSFEEFAEVFYLADKSVSVRGFEERMSCYITLMSEGITVYDNVTEEEKEFYCYDMDELVEEVTAWIKELEAE